MSDLSPINKQPEVGLFSVQSKTQDPPDPLVAGETWVVPPNPTYSSWIGHDNEVATYEGLGVWSFATPAAWTQMVWTLDVSGAWIWDGTTWLVATTTTHASLEGLHQDDHQIYAYLPMDVPSYSLLMRSATGARQFESVPIGSPGGILATGSGGSGYEFISQSSLPYEPVITAGGSGDYWRGDKTWQTLDTFAVPENMNLYWTQARFDTAFLSAQVADSSHTGLLSSTDWSVFNGKEPVIPAGTSSQYWRGDKTWQTLPTPDLSVYVPYTGATSNVDLGAHTLLTNSIKSRDGMSNLTISGQPNSGGPGSSVTIAGGSAGQTISSYGGAVILKAGGAEIPGYGGQFGGADVNIAGGDSGSTGNIGAVNLDAGAGTPSYNIPVLRLGPTYAQQIYLFGTNTVGSEITFYRGSGAIHKYAPSAPSFTSTVATGTAPMTVASATVVSNLNADLLDGNHASYFQSALGYTPENVLNKSINVLTDAESDAKYPSVKAVKTYADGLVAGLLDYRGAYDASVNTYPASGGSGLSGSVLKGDMWIISVAGTLGGSAIQVGDSIIAGTDAPGQTAANWNTLNTNITYVPEDSANKVTFISSASTDTQYPSAKLLYDQLATKQPTGAYLTVETDPAFSSWLSTTPPLYSETDPLSLHLNQATPQTFTNLGGGTGLMKVTAGLLGLDTSTYLTSFTETDPVFSNWLSTTPPLYTETDPVFNAWKTATPPLYAEADTLDSVAGRGGSTTHPITVDPGAQAAAAPPADALAAVNTTASTSGATVQNSPAIRMEAHGWDTGAGGADRKHEFRWYVAPASAATSTVTFKLGYSANGGAETFPLTVTNGGAMNLGSIVTSSSISGGSSLYGAGPVGNSALTPTTSTGLTQVIPLNGSPATSDVIVLDTTSAGNRGRKALTADATAIVIGVKNAYGYPAIGGYCVVNCDAADVAIGDTLVVSTALDGAAMTNNAETNPKYIVGYALSAKTTGSVGTVSLWLK